MSKLERTKPEQGVELANQGVFNRYYRVFVEEGFVVAVTRWGGIDGYYVPAKKYMADQAELKRLKADLSKVSADMETLKKRRTNVYAKDGALIV